MAIIKIIEEILTNNKSTDINYILSLIQKNILKQYDNSITQTKHQDKKEKYREGNFLNITKEHILKELYERHQMQYLISSNIWKNKDEWQSELEDNNSFNISRIQPGIELDVKKDIKVVKEVQNNGKLN